MMLLILNVLVFLLPFCLASANAAEPYPFSGFLFLVLLSVFSAWWFIVRGFPARSLRPIRTPLILSFLAIVASALCAFRQPGNPEEINKYFTGFLLFSIAAGLSGEEKKQLLSGMIGAALCISFMAIFQYFFGFRLLLNYVIEKNINDPFVLEKILQQRVFYPFPVPGALAGYLAMTLPLVICLKRWRVLCLLPLTLALFLTKSLGAFLSLTIVTAIMLIMQKHSVQKRSLVLLALGGIIVCVFLIRIHTTALHLLPIYSIEQRLYYWKGAWNIIRAHPWVGLGPGTFDLPGDSFYAHNIILQLWAETGIGAVIAFGWLIVAILRKSWNALKKDPERQQQLGLFAAACVFFVYNLADFTFFLPATNFLGWLVMGMLFAATREAGETTSTTPPSPR